MFCCPSVKSKMGVTEFVLSVKTIATSFITRRSSSERNRGAAHDAMRDAVHSIEQARQADQQQE